MAESLSYDSLVTDVQTYAERDDTPFVTQIPRLIMLAENRLALEIKGLGFLRVVTVPLSLDNAVYEKPARWRETKNFSISSGGVTTFLKPRGYEYCKIYNSDAAATAMPLYYSDYDYEHYYIAATPNGSYSAEISYYERPEPLTATNQTNWVTQYAPQLLLYATLLEAQPFLKRPERVQEFQMFYDRAASGLLKEDSLKVTDNSVVRSK